MLLSFVKFLWKDHKKEILIAALVFGLLYYFYVYQQNPNFVDTYEDVLSPLVSISTVFAAFLIWWSERHRVWKDDYLPKKLTVIYQFNKQPVMICRNISLLSEADMRAFSQQIGAQMSGIRKLQFSPDFDNSISPRISKNNKDEYHKLYTVAIHLTSLPGLAENGANKDLYPRFENEYREWNWENNEQVNEENEWVKISRKK